MTNKKETVPEVPVQEQSKEENSKTINQIRRDYSLEPIEGGDITIHKSISKEKLEWMEEIGIKEFDKPMKYHAGVNWLYSEEYIKNTPLEELKRKYDKRLVELGEPTINDSDVK